LNAVEFKKQTKSVYSISSSGKSSTRFSKRVY
jgi:hypothetical protein